MKRLSFSMSRDSLQSTRFFISNTFISNARLKLATNQANGIKQIKQLLTNFCYLKIIHILHSHYHPKTVRHTLKNTQKNMYVCIHEL